MISSRLLTRVSHVLTLLRVMRRPHYPLDEVVRLAKTRGSRQVTEQAANDAKWKFGFSRDDVFALVAQLTPEGFEKTMPSLKRPGTFQDVYRPTVTSAAFSEGIETYVKVQLEADPTTQGAFVLLIVLACKS